MFITTNKSPFGPLLGPESPWLLSLKCCPSSTPAGMSTFIFLWLSFIPFPLHLLQGLSITFPVPLHLLHTFVVILCIKPRLCTSLTIPCPSHCEQCSNEPPSLAPEPLQSEQLSFLGTVISFSIPRYASSKLTFISYRKSFPRLFCCLLLPPPKNWENTSPRPPPWNICSKISDTSPAFVNWSQENPPEPKLTPSCPNWLYLSLFSSSASIS